MRALVQHRVRKGEPPETGHLAPTRARTRVRPEDAPPESTSPPDSSVAWEPEFLTSVHT